MIYTLYNINSFLHYMYSYMCELLFHIRWKFVVCHKYNLKLNRIKRTPLNTYIHVCTLFYRQPCVYGYGLRQIVITTRLVKQFKYTMTHDRGYYFIIWGGYQSHEKHCRLKATRMLWDLNSQGSSSRANSQPVYIIKHYFLNVWTFV